MAETEEVAALAAAARAELEAREGWATAAMAHEASVARRNTAAAAAAAASRAAATAGWAAAAAAAAGSAASELADAERELEEAAVVQNLAEERVAERVRQRRDAEFQVDNQAAAAEPMLLPGVRQRLESMEAVRRGERRRRRRRRPRRRRRRRRRSRRRRRAAAPAEAPAEAPAAQSAAPAPWTPAEDTHILQRFRELGAQWHTIAETLEGRSANQVRNRWMTLARGATLSWTGVRRVPPAAPQATSQQRQRADDLRFLRDLIERVNDAHPEVVSEGEYLRASNITCALWKENEGRAPMPRQRSVPPPPALSRQGTRLRAPTNRPPAPSQRATMHLGYYDSAEDAAVAVAEAAAAMQTAAAMAQQADAPEGTAPPTAPPAAPLGLGLPDLIQRPGSPPRWTPAQLADAAATVRAERAPTVERLSDTTYISTARDPDGNELRHIMTERPAPRYQRAVPTQPAAAAAARVVVDGPRVVVQVPRAVVESTRMAAAERAARARSLDRWAARSAAGATRAAAFAAMAEIEDDSDDSSGWVDAAPADAAGGLAIDDPMADVE